jgi:hypothetical protein
MGILLGIIFWVGETSVFQIYHFLFHNNPENVSYETKLWLSLFPHTSFLFSCETLAALEMRNIGLTTDTL